VHALTSGSTVQVFLIDGAVAVSETDPIQGHRKKKR
jgi:hypothetical protein